MTAARIPASPQRPTLYCIVPAELAAELHEPLRRHFRDESRIEVVVEQRVRQRRSGSERRVAEGEPPTRTERRRIRGIGGRRVADRRASLVPSPVRPPLPRRARRHAERLTFVERLEPSTQELEDRDTARLVTCFQAGEREVFNPLYARYFDRVYGYVRMAVRDPHESEDLTQQVFMNVFEGLGRYERREQPFRAWLFRVVRNQVISHLRRAGVDESLDPLAIAEHEEANGGDAEASSVLDWITDRDLIIFVERLPLLQRQILLLSYGLDMTSEQIAEILDINAVHVRSAKRRAITFLRARLAAVGRTPERHVREHPRMRRWGSVATVIRRRRFALQRR